MITLSTLNEATHQEIFDQVAKHLLTQKVKCIERGECLYRNSEGLKCAAGILIADKEYKISFEGRKIVSILGEYPVNEDTAYFVESLQMLHDCGPVFNWKRRLKDFAFARRLQWKEELELL